MNQTLSHLFRFRDLRSFPLTAMHMVMATRLCIMFGRPGGTPCPTWRCGCAAWTRRGDWRGWYTASSRAGPSSSSFTGRAA